jgi:hypothetical protein
MLGVGRDGARRIWAAQVGRVVELVGSRRVLSDARQAIAVVGRGTRLRGWLRWVGVAVGLLGGGRRGPGSPRWQGLAGGDLGGHLRQLSTRRPGRPVQVVNACCASRRSRSSRAPLARSIRPRESSAVWSCSARAPVSSALAAAPSRLATTPASAGAAVTSVSSQPRGSTADTSSVPIGPPPSSTGTLRPSGSGPRQRSGRPPPTAAPGGVVHHRRAAAGERLGAGPAAKTSWLSANVWARSSEALAQPQVAVGVGQHDPGRLNVEQLLGRLHGLLQGGGRSRVGSRSFRVPMRLASIEGRSAWVPLLRSPNWRTRSTSQAAMMALGADQAQPPTRSCGRYADPRPSTEPESARPPDAPPAGAHRDAPRAAGQPGIGHRVAWLGHHWLLRPRTSLGGLVPAAGSGWTQIPSACVSWPEQPPTPATPQGPNRPSRE